MKQTLNWLFDYPTLKVYQYEEAFKFSLDSILLFEFAQIKKNDNKIMDFCTGNAVIPILVYNKYKKDVVGIEYQKEIYDLAVESVKQNKMEKHISLIHDTLLNVKNYFPGNNFDVILCNPPYFKYEQTSHINKNELKSVARHEITLKLEDIFVMAKYLLKDNGKIYMVHIPSRIDELIVYANKYGFAVKELQFIQAKENAKPEIVLLTCVKSGNFGTKVYAPINIHNLTTYQNIFRR